MAEVAALPAPSVSKGAPQDGRILHAAELPLEGAGYEVGATWRARHTNYGTAELVRAIEKAAASVAAAYPGSLVEIADMARQDGGALGHHASHESGRDVDVVYYSTDLDGDPLPPPADMIPYAPDGTARATDGHGRIRRFDDARNWEFVRTLLTDPSVQVEWVFMQHDLRDRLLAYAQAAGEPPSLLEQAERVLHQPTDSLPHDDHMHVRIACPAQDVALGCIDIEMRHHHRNHHHRHRRHGVHRAARVLPHRHRRRSV